MKPVVQRRSFLGDVSQGQLHVYSVGRERSFCKFLHSAMGNPTKNIPHLALMQPATLDLMEMEEELGGESKSEAANTSTT